jgi:MoaA/NifB/PqqE/SkfB family radical SAM enzyme
MENNHQNYLNEFALNKDRYRDYPRKISIETHVNCNAKCFFCPYPTSERKGEVLDKDVMEKIFSDLKDIPFEHKYELIFCRINEPFLDPRVIEYVKKVDKDLKNARQMFWSNGTMINKNVIEIIKNISNSILYISFNSSDEDQHKDLMGFGLKKVLKNLDYVHTLKKSSDFKPQVKLTLINNELANQTQKFIAERYPLFSSNVREYFEWRGESFTNKSKFLKNKINDAEDLPCNQYFDLHLLANNMQTFCCIDENGMSGNENDIRKNHILDLYNLKKKFRLNSTPRKSIKKCNECNFYG